MLTIQRLPQPVIARVHGIATAAGCQLVAACDLAVCSRATRASPRPGINFGLFCSTPGVPVSRNVSRKRAMEMLLTGEFIDAPTALAWGLVNRVVPAQELDAETDELAHRIMDEAARRCSPPASGSSTRSSSVAIEDAYRAASDGDHAQHAGATMRRRA